MTSLDDIYIIGRPDDGWSGQVYGVTSEIMFQQSKCLNCNEVLYASQPTSLEVELFGKEFRHFVWLDDPVVVVTDEFYSFLIGNKLSGFDKRPLNVLNQGDLYNTSISYLHITGSAGSIEATTNLKKQNGCEQCHRYSLVKDALIYVDPRQWDGSDMFMVNELRVIFITYKFISILESNQITNFSVKPAYWANVDNRSSA